MLKEWAVISTVCRQNLKNIVNRSADFISYIFVCAVNNLCQFCIHLSAIGWLCTYALVYCRHCQTVALICPLAL